jgi:hypothetical protein
LGAYSCKKLINSALLLIRSKRLEKYVIKRGGLFLSDGEQHQQLSFSPLFLPWSPLSQLLQPTGADPTCCSPRYNIIIGSQQYKQGQ